VQTKRVSMLYVAAAAVATTSVANMFAEWGKAWPQMQTLRYATKSTHRHI